LATELIGLGGDVDAEVQGGVDASDFGDGEVDTVAITVGAIDVEVAASFGDSVMLAPSPRVSN